MTPTLSVVPGSELIVLVLGVAGMSAADSADIVQFADNGTPDHNWRVVV